MTLFFFYTFFALVLKFTQKCLLQYRQTNQNKFNLKTDTISLEERLKNSLSHKINISLSVVSVDISSPVFLFRFYSPSPVVLKSVTCMAAKLQFLPRR